jgi:thioredoxin reductase (NADPH)
MRHLADAFRYIIIGSGPAGLTAALYAARSNCCPLLIQGGQPGGQLTTTTTVDNFPGFPEGVDGPELMQRMEQQVRRFSENLVTGEVTRVDLAATPFQVWVGETCYRGRTLIVATGASPRMLGLPNEWDLMGRGVSVCATCDAIFYRDKEVVVVGGGDTALEEAFFLARFARKVTIIHRRGALRATPILQQRAMENEKFFWRWETVVTEILGSRDAGVRGVRLRHIRTGEVTELACHGLFIAIGHTPNTGLFRGQLDLDERGYIVTRNYTATSVPGVFAAGDVQDPHFRQAITAAGSGAMAAIQAERYLECLADQGEGKACSLEMFGSGRQAP